MIPHGSLDSPSALETTSVTTGLGKTAKYALPDWLTACFPGRGIGRAATVHGNDSCPST